MATPTANELKQRLKALVLLSIAIPLLLLALPFLLVYGIIWWFWGYVLAHWCWRAHGRHGRDVLFVYSNSPNWEAYIEENILPRIRDRAVILNWSERKLWPQRCPWEARAFRYWAGSGRVQSSCHRPQPLEGNSSRPLLLRLP